jgi:hypothetical protein
LEDAARRTKKQVISSEYLSCELNRGEESRTELSCESERKTETEKRPAFERWPQRVEVCRRRQAAARRRRKALWVLISRYRNRVLCCWVVVAFALLSWVVLLLVVVVVPLSLSLSLSLSFSLFFFCLHILLSCCCCCSHVFFLHETFFLRNCLFGEHFHWIDSNAADCICNFNKQFFSPLEFMECNLCFSLACLFLSGFWEMLV